MTSTVHPPVLDPTIPGTPAGEWADKTTSALVPDGYQPAVNQSTVTTPGAELPGAFPASHETSNSTLTAQGIQDTIVDTARTYLPQGMINTMENYLGTTPSSSVKASENDVTHQTSYPSQELVGAHSGEKVAGAGSLPGTILASGVADPTFERSADDKIAPGYIAAAKDTLQGSLPPAVAGALGIASAGGNQTSLPSQEKTGAQPNEHVGGVGALPGNNSEAGVTQLPLERNGENKEPSRTVEGGDDSTIAKAKDAVSQVKSVAFNISPVGSSKEDTSLPSQDSSGQQPGEKSGGVGALPGSKDESGVAVLPHEKSTSTDISSRKSDDDKYNPNTATGSQSTGIPGIPNSVDPNVQSKEKEGVKNGQPVAQLEPRIHPMGGAGASWKGVDLSPKGVDQWEHDAAKDLPPRPTDASVHPDDGTKNDTLPKEGISAIPGVPPKAESAESPPIPPKHDNTTVPSGGPQKFPGDEEGYHPAEIHPAVTKHSHEHVPEKKSAASDSHSETTTGSGHKKVGFMEKISGGSKLLMGKLEHNQEKVEEGRKIMHGEA